MMKNQLQKPLLALAMIGGLAVAGQVFAQDCATPFPLRSNQSNYLGDTCTAGNPLPTYGGTGSPQNEIVYSFVALNANASISIDAVGGYAGTTAAIFLLPACTASTDPIAFGAPGVPMVINGMTDGQTYYVVATADPGGPNNGCGQYRLSVTGPVPVALQNFSVE